MTKHSHWSKVRKSPSWYVEQDGAGPYVCESGTGRIASLELTSLKTNGGPDDWQRARLMAAAPSLQTALLAIVRAWRTIGELEQVPECINRPELWEAAEAALQKSLPVARQPT